MPGVGPDESGLRLVDGDLPVDAGAGLPMCTATLRYPARGYAAAMGWIQLVRSDDGQDPEHYEPDPVPLHQDANTPYTYFGIRPVLFDAPYRPLDRDLRWRARTYLAASDDAVISRIARPIVAFAWGFEIGRGQVHLDTPTAMAVNTWSEHTATLSAAYPGWQF